MEAVSPEDWIFDFGNSRAKLGIPQPHTEWQVLIGAQALQMAQDRLHSTLPPPRVLWTATGGVPEPWRAWRTEAQQRWGTSSFHRVPQDWTPHFAMEIEGRSTLGLDRLAHAAAAIEADPQAVWWIVDAGTVLVCDLIVAGCFRGGTLSPGWDMRFRSLYDGTAGLPWIAGWRHMMMKARVYGAPERGTSAAASEPDAWGRDTLSAILNGVASGIAGEIRWRLADLAYIYPQIQVVITGGDGEYLHIPHNGAIFADPYFTLRGYHAILRQLAPLP